MPQPWNVKTHLVFRGLVLRLRALCKLYREREDSSFLIVWLVRNPSHSSPRWDRSRHRVGAIAPASTALCISSAQTQYKLDAGMSQFVFLRKAESSWRGNLRKSLIVEPSSLSALCNLWPFSNQDKLSDTNGCLYWWDQDDALQYNWLIRSIKDSVGLICGPVFVSAFGYVTQMQVDGQPSSYGPGGGNTHRMYEACATKNI